MFDPIGFPVHDLAVDRAALIAFGEPGHSPKPGIHMAIRAATRASIPTATITRPSATPPRPE